MKKIFYILFAFYFFSLALVPCGDKEDCNEVRQAQAAQAGHDKTHADEICTPFCVCSCCATHFVIKSFQPLPHLVAVIDTIYTVQKDAKVSSAIIAIWQPPKLS